jgi:NADH dehydrogenase (ubiquinone) 1 alpha subcomplex subunit 5
MLHHSQTNNPRLSTHPSPRPALIYTYNQTLQKLSQLPPSSVYRQSAEALTKHRLAIVSSTKPAGYEEWLARVKKQIEAAPEAYKSMKNPDGSLSHMKVYTEKSISWDGEWKRGQAIQEGTNTAAEAEAKGKKVAEEVERVDKAATEGVVPNEDDLEVEPPLNADQINEIEVKIGAGLIEEVVMVAEGELTLVDKMLESKVWENLEEQPAPGQWEYFERGDRV